MTLNDIEKQIIHHKSTVQKAITHLEYSFAKVSKFKGDLDLEDLEKLETYESFTSRFSRLSDIFVKKLLRSLILKDDPSFRGGLMDLLNHAEKLDLISDANRWWEVRSLRNREAHEYTVDDLRDYFAAVEQQVEFVLKEANKVLKGL